MPRIAVFADTHGNKKMVEDALVHNGAFDLVIHLGDGLDDGLSVAGERELSFLGVQGNEDYAYRMTVPTELVFESAAWRFFAVHGDQMDINVYHPESLWQRNIAEMVRWTKQKGAQVFLFGHSHQTLLREEQGVVLCNPGDQYLGSQSAPTFAVIDATAFDLEIRIMQRVDDGIRRWRVINVLRRRVSETDGE